MTADAGHPGPSGSSLAEVQTAWSRLLLSSLADAGVEDVVLSPGSRSTPLVLAALEEKRLRCHDVVDERAAGYFALGLARVNGRPALLLSTSGTAAANYLPAVVEAGVSSIPLLVLTADRPMELAHCGANQTIDQLKLFGQHARQFFDLGAAEALPRALRGLRRTAMQAVFTSRWPEPGAVHLNARLRKPLEPPSSALPSKNDGPTATVDELLSRPGPDPRIPRTTPQALDLENLADRLRRARRGVLVCGPAPLAWSSANNLLIEVARRAGLAVFADPASPLRFGAPEGDAPFVDSFDALLKSPSFVQWFQPDLVLQIGRTLTSGAWERFLGQHDEIDHQVIASHGWHDPASTANGLLFGDLDAVLSGLLELLPGFRERGSWLDDLGSIDHLALDLAEKELATSAELSEGSVARSVAEALPNGALLVVGNSLPIRQLDTWGLRRGGVGVVSQRGASGIDGLVAGSAGSALAHGGPTLLLLGDVSFLHDLSGLESVLQVSTPLVLVVVQNRGGRIFEQLPVARHPEVPSAQLSHWFTPHEGDFEGAARLHGLPFYRTDSLPGLQKALHKALDHPRASVVEAIVPPHGAAEQGRRLVEKVEEAVVGFLDR